MRTEATTLRSGTEGKARSAVLVSLALGAVLAALVALMAAPAREAEATFPGTNGKIVFISKRTTGTGVDNPTGDSEIFTINPDGTGLKQLTTNTGDDREPTLSPDGQKIAYTSQGDPDLEPRGRLRGLPHERLGRVGTDEPLKQAAPPTAPPSSLPTARRSPTRAATSRPPTPRATTRST